MYLLFILIIFNLIYSQEKWVKLQSPIEEGIHKLSFVGEHNGWAISYGTGKILHTTNGRDWSVIAQLNSNYLESIQFIDKNTGFVSGDFGNVYKTIDAGKTWEDISPTIHRITKAQQSDSIKTDGLLVYYYSMYFKNSEHGVVSGFTVNPKLGFRASRKSISFKTRNSGKSWIEISKDALQNFKSEKEPIKSKKILDTYFYDNNAAWKLKSKAEKVIICNSQDGGNTWEEKTLPNINKWIVRGVIFTNKQHGIVVGGYKRPKESETVFGSAVVFTTRDAGQTWDLEENNLPAIHDIAATKAKLWVVGQDGLIAYKKSEDSFVDPFDRKVYKTRVMNRVEWFVEDYARHSENQKGSWLYKSDNINASLYSRNAAIKNLPRGWRLPTVNDWLNLISIVADSAELKDRFRVKRQQVKEELDLTHFGVRMKGRNLPVPMGVYWTSSDTMFVKDNIAIEKYIGIHIYSKNDSLLIIEPTYINKSTIENDQSMYGFSVRYLRNE
jgi:uncharacterized protein (TIGR02145 family)